MLPVNLSSLDCSVFFFFSSHYDRRSLLQAIKHLKLAFMNSGPMIFVDIINLHLTSPGL